MSHEEGAEALVASAPSSASQGALHESNYAFLIHSQESLSQQSLSTSDDPRLPRQRRRRTSPGDHAVLEAEYAKNPKPDKAARLAIVSKVALGEKEVQIWFQNRRQVTRRKSRPLLPHEILANLRPSDGNTDTTLPSSFSTDASYDQDLSSSQNSTHDTQNSTRIAEVEGSKQISCVPGLSSSQVSDEATTDARNARVAPPSVHIPATRRPRLNIQDGTPRHLAPLARSQSQTLPQKDRSKSRLPRRSVSFLIHDEASQPSITRPEESQGRPGKEIPSRLQKPPGKGSSPALRLSLSLDGEAQVLMGSGLTPSPPQSKPAAEVGPVSRIPIGLQRSQSMIEPGTRSLTDSFPLPSSRHSMVGRSRDARTWEFYCDKDARDALNEQAEREESGSALAAISLLKSSSNNAKAFLPKLNKRNAQNQREQEAIKRQKSGHMNQRPTLGRSKSSVANIKGANKKTGQEISGIGKPVRKSGSQSAVFEIYEGDSDKENWIPGTQISAQPRQGTESNPSQTGRRVLGVNGHRVNNSSAARIRARESSSNPSHAKGDDKENGSPTTSDGDAGDEEVARFMGREADELDCVQNLLSLSQGAWR